MSYILNVPGTEIDSLVYSQPDSILTDQELNNNNITLPLTSLPNGAQYIFGSEAGTTLQCAADTQCSSNYMDAVLNASIIKRACCQDMIEVDPIDGNIPITVRIPAPENWPYGNNQYDVTAEKFGYIDKTVYVPSSVCNTLIPNYKYGSGICDDFMHSYCANANEIYRSQAENYDLTEFANYKPECGCYGDRPGFLQTIGARADNIPAKCFNPGCNPSVFKTVYLDPTSRNNQCDITLCEAVVNYENNTVGGNFTSNTTIQQECGPYMEAHKPTPPPIPTSTPANTPTSTPANTTPTSIPTPANTTPTSTPTSTPNIISEEEGNPPSHTNNIITIIIISVSCILLLCILCIIWLYKRHRK